VFFNHKLFMMTFIFVFLHHQVMTTGKTETLANAHKRYTT